MQIAHRLPWFTIERLIDLEFLLPQDCSLCCPLFFRFNCRWSSGSCWK